MSRRVLLAAALAFGLAVPVRAFAQSTPSAVAELERRAEAAQGVDRARLLADLVDRLRIDNPVKAIAYGREALALLDAAPDDAARVRALNGMAWAYMQRGDFAEASARAEQARAIAGASSNDEGLGDAINNLGVIAQRSGHALAAIGFFEQSLAIFRGLGSQVDIANALNNLGFVHGTDLADYEKSLEYHVEALRVREALADDNAIALSLNNIGIVYDRLGEHTRALEYFQRSLALRTKAGAVNRSAGTLANIGDLYLEIGNLDEAFAYHTRAHEIRVRIGEKPAIANSLMSLGKIYTAMGKPAEARARLGEALAASREIKDRSTETNSLLGLAALERQLGRGREAAVLAAEALARAEASRSRELERRALEQLAAAEEMAGRTAAALASFKRLKTLEDRIFADDKALRIDMLERRYQAEKQQAENERLRARQELSAVQASRTRLQRNAVAGAGLLALAIGFVLYRRRVDAARLASELSVTDALTGLRNRRYVEQTIEADVAAALRRARTDADDGLVFMMIDVDHFKAINDTHGHKAGDAMLIAFAGILKATCRASDTVARWGGEEFLIVCRATGRREAAVLAERLRAAVGAHAFAPRGRMTCSLGFAALPFPGRELTWEQAIALADAALYEAKRRGRDCWVDAYALEETAPPRQRLDRAATAGAGPD
jgi:diguanylate cyclase (GGDEF)-like protein